MNPRGRLYRVEVEITYLGGTLPTDIAEALERGLADASFTVRPHAHAIATVSATVREDSPVAAVAELSARIDRAMARTGVLEEFDHTGKIIRVAPLEHADRLEQSFG